MQLPEKTMYDVCSQWSLIPREMRRFIAREYIYYITHNHWDHLPAYVGLTLRCSSALARKLSRTVYRGLPMNYEIVNKDECLLSYHRIRDRLTGKEYRVDTYNYLLKHGVAIIAECWNARDFLIEYGPKYPIVVMFKQPATHPQNQQVSYDELRELCDYAYFADPSVWRPYGDYVLPKLIPSIKDVFHDHTKYPESPFSKRF